MTDSIRDVSWLVEELKRREIEVDQLRTRLDAGEVEDLGPESLQITSIERDLAELKRELEVLQLRQ